MRVEPTMKCHVLIDRRHPLEPEHQGRLGHRGRTEDLFFPGWNVEELTYKIPPGLSGFLSYVALFFLLGYQDRASIWASNEWCRTKNTMVQ